MSPLSVTAFLGLIVLTAPPAMPAETLLISTDSAGNALTEEARSGRMSADGRYIVFVTRAGINPVQADTNGLADVYLRDRVTGTIELISRTPTGAAGNASSDTPFVSADGRYVVYSSHSTDLIPVDNNPLYEDVFLHDRMTHTNTVVSVDNAGMQRVDNHQAWGISGDGRRVLWVTAASMTPNEPTPAGADAYVRDLNTNTTILASSNSQGITTSTTFGVVSCSISYDGRFVAFDINTSLLPSDTDFDTDVYVKDVQTGQVVLASSDSSWQNPSTGFGYAPSIDATGRYVAFLGYNLVPLSQIHSIVVYRKDLWTGSITIASRSTKGSVANDHSTSVRISGDGRFVAYASLATNLWSDDLADSQDVFLTDMARGFTIRASSVPLTGSSPVGTSSIADLSFDGRYILMDSDANDLASAGAVPALPFPPTRVYLRDRLGFENLGGQTLGIPPGAVLTGTGSLATGANGSLNLTNAIPNGPAILMLSIAPDPQPAFAGLLRAYPANVTVLFTTQSNGTITLPFVSASTVPAVFAQFAYLGTNGPSLSNGLYLGFE